MTTLSLILAASTEAAAKTSGSGPLVLAIGVSILLLLFWYMATEKLKRKRNIGTVIIVAIAICSFLAIIPPSGISAVLSGDKYKDGKKDETGEKMTFIGASNLSGGIDLVGGTAVTMQVQENEDENGNKIPLDARALAVARDRLQERIDVYGNLNAEINIVGKNRIEIQIPKIDPTRAKEIIDKLTTAAKLTFHSCHPNGANSALAKQVFDGDEIEPGYKAVAEYEFNKETKKEEAIAYYLIRRKAALTGAYVETAFADTVNPGQVNIRLTSEGGSKMIDFTGSMKQGDYIISVLDGKVVSAATLRANTLGRDFQISGQENAKESQVLAEALLNPLENDIEVIKKQSVSATLGEATVNQGISAGIAGLALTLIFVLLYYRFAGIIALIGLVLNILILFGAMAAFGAAFTLPGIAGIILTIGVAVDANVLIYERMREELALGKSVKAAIAAAYDKAFAAIFDANITTLITAMILFWQAAGSIRGFAVTLTIGILGTLLAALLCTRVLFWWSADTGLLKNIKFMNLIPQRSFDFLSKRKIAGLLSTILIISGLAMIGIKGKQNLGVDFTGGNILRYSIAQDSPITQPDVEAALKNLDLKQSHSSQIEGTSDLGLSGGRFIKIKCGDKEHDGTSDKDLIVKTMKETFNFTEQPAEEKVSAALGDEFLKKAIWALALGLFCVLIYITIRFEFSFAVGAFFALLHDILIVLGMLMFFDQELSLIHISAFLTIIGYSINDTIVVFDRIRESLKTQRGEIKDVMNAAISATLSRTILTSVTTFVAVLVLYIYGGSSLKEFSLTIMIGVVVGTYSSIFVASPIVYMFSKIRKTDLRRELLDANLEAEINPTVK